jgi:uncharacterized protein YdhG (YjbR/CyaY superfamily)
VDDAPGHWFRARDGVVTARSGLCEEGVAERLFERPTLYIVSRVSVVDDYFEGLDPSTRAVFEHIRAVVMDIVPDAEDGTSYGMAALRYKRKPLLGFLAAKDHLSVFPFSSRVVDVVREPLPAFELSKGTIRFTLGMPLPDEVVRDIVRLRIDEIVGTVR